MEPAISASAALVAARFPAPSAAAGGPPLHAIASGQARGYAFHHTFHAPPGVWRKLSLSSRSSSRAEASHGAERNEIATLLTAPIATRSRARRSEGTSG